MLALAARLTGVELDDSQQREITAVLRAAGARFALLHGSRVNGRARPDSDIDVAAWWDGAAPASFEVDLPADVDLVVLNGAPLELAGRIAVDGQLLYDDDPPARSDGWPPLARSTSTSGRGCCAPTGSSSRR